jgi:hypothetical protein
VSTVKPDWQCVLLAAALAAVSCGCSHLAGEGGGLAPDEQVAVTRAIAEVKQKYAPHAQLAIFDVGVEGWGRELALTGEVDRAEARIDCVQAVQRAGARVSDRIKVLPEERLEDQVWGIGDLSVVSGRLQPGQKAEMGTQVLMGEPVRVWKRSTNAVYAWYLAQSADGYLSWLQKGTFVRCTHAEVEAWLKGPLLIVTAFEERIL